MKQKLNRLLSGLLALVLMVPVLSAAVSARELLDPNRKGSISLSLKFRTEHEEKPHSVVGAEISLYKVAALNFDDNGNETLYGESGFETVDLGIIKTLEDFRNAELLNKLSRLIKEKKIAPTDSKLTANDGSVKFTNLPVGLYYVAMTRQDSLHHSIKPFLVTLPFHNEDGSISYDVSASPKMEVIFNTVDVKVIKEWKNDKESDRPQSITVELLCDGNVYETAELSSYNDWTYVFYDLPGGFTWKVQEKQVPSGYTGEVSGPWVQDNTYVFTITNTRNAPPPPLLQTGQLNWPVPVMAVAGILFMLLGWSLCNGRKKEQ